MCSGLSINIALIIKQKYNDAEKKMYKYQMVFKSFSSNLVLFLLPCSAVAQTQGLLKSGSIHFNFLVQRFLAPRMVRSSCVVMNAPLILRKKLWFSSQRPKTPTLAQYNCHPGCKDRDQTSTTRARSMSFVKEMPCWN